MPTPLCLSEALESVKRLNEVAIFCLGKAARATNHTQRSYWISNHELNVRWREDALANAIGWAERGEG